MKWNERRSSILVIIFSAAIIVGLSTLSQYVQWREEKNPARRQHHPATVRPVLREATSASKLPLQHTDSSFTIAMDRLNRAFQNHASMDVEDLVAKVNADTPAGQEQPCPLAWHDNEATLSVQSDHLDKLSPERAVTTCAEAIEQLP